MYKTLGSSLMIIGVVAGLFAFYCLYRLWKYGPYNANLIFSIIFPFANALSVLFIGAGVGLYTWSIPWLVGGLILSFAVENSVFSFYVLRQGILYEEIEDEAITKFFSKAANKRSLFE